MNKKNIILSLSYLAGALLFSSQLHASVTVQFSAGSIRQFDNTLASLGSKGVLVADTGNDGFLGDYINSSLDLGAFDGSTLAVGQTLGSTSNDQIVGVFDVTDFGGGFVGFNDEINFNLGSVSTGQALALYWFPTVFSSDIVGNLTQYGFFRSDSADSGADIGFFVQADGSNDILAAVDSTFDTTAPSPSRLTAVPEPSSFALLAGVFGLAWVMVRHRA